MGRRGHRLDPTQGCPCVELQDSGVNTNTFKLQLEREKTEKFNADNTCYVISHNELSFPTSTRKGKYRKE